MQGTLMKHNIGVDQGDVGGPRHLGTKLARYRKALPLVGDHDGAILAGNLDRAIGRLSIYHYDRLRLLLYCRFHARWEEALDVARWHDNVHVREPQVLSD